MAERPSWDGASSSASVAPAAEELAQLRQLLLGPEQRQLEALRRRLDAMGLTAEQVAQLLPDAIALRTARDAQLARALAPTVENAISESVRRNPRELASAIFPVLGPAIRKAIAETMAELVASINRAIEHSVSPRGLRWRFESWRTGVPFAQIVLRHALVYRVEQVYLIHAETGLLLAHAAAADLPVADADLISGMLTAIREFVADSFGTDGAAGGLRTFSVGERTVMVEQGPRAMIAAVVRGTPPEHLLRRLQDALESIHAQFARPLAAFDGDGAPFVEARPILSDLLETVLADRERGRVRWEPWAIGGALVAAALIALAVRSSMHWNRAVERLEREPGLVLVEAQRSWGTWHLAGLRDPLAPSPMALLAAEGVDTARVRGVWRPYRSLETPMVLAHARRSLLPPATVAFALAGDTLRARGPAPLTWMARVAAQQVLPPGVAAVDLTGVEPKLPPELAGLASALEEGRVLFAVGSSALDATAAAQLSTAAEQFRQLEEKLPAVRGLIGVELWGRADTTGSEALNRELSERRAETVRAALVQRGVPAAQLRVLGVGTSRPLSAADREAQARINRSVSFVVRVRRPLSVAEAMR